MSAILWKAFAAEQVDETEAGEISLLIQARKALPPIAKPKPKPKPIWVGSRPRSPASVERRRSWAASGRLPPSLSARFSTGELAVLVVVATQVKKSGDCRWPHARIAAIAGVSESTTRRALRAARELGLVKIEERRVSAFRNEPNIVRIISPEWRAWLRVGGGGQVWPRTDNKKFPGRRTRIDATSRSECDGGSNTRSAGPGLQNFDRLGPSRATGYFGG
ncbi:transcriptional regulator [Methylobacterium sp. SD274]|uniref:transcriptional regulator n=1 Tax=Methylobacterium sp. SD274 TaxID=2782009 RepID=UPI001A967883|nr:transcriptional regulator [Methylobacterium sp. SD274]MBO1023008.1 transcriptional regulator [Methylobacterium sp. SD274]